MATQSPYVTQAPNMVQTMVAPDLAAQQLQLQRAQQYADMLKQQGAAPLGDTQYVTGAGPTRAVARSPVEGLAKMLNAYMGRKSQEDIDQQQLGLNKDMAQRYAQLLNGTASDSNASQAALGMGATNGSVGPTVDNAAAMDKMTQNQGQPQNSAFNMANLLRGQIAQSVGGDAAAGAYWDQFKQTPEIKNNQWMGRTPQMALAAKLAEDKKNAEVERKPLSQFRNFLTEESGIVPKIPENANPVGSIAPNGALTEGVTSMPGANAIQRNNAYSGAIGTAAAKPAIGYDEKGNPIATNDAVMATGGFPKVSAQDQFARNNERLRIMQDELPNITDPKDRAALQAEIARTQAANNSGNPFTINDRPLAPALPAGVQAYKESQGKSAEDRAKQIRTFAAESPMRVNVLDNLLGLSQKGVQTGPGADFQNNVKGLVANFPGFKDTPIAKNWRGDVSDYQEFKKFAMQNAQRAWQAAGGTGTDAQLEASIDANLNSKLFPQAVQAIAKWSKAGELAAQAKANAQDNFLAKNGDSPQNQQQFENTWRNSLDPRLYQLRVMDPKEATTFVTNLKKTDPRGYDSLMQKAQTLKQLGGL